MTDWPHSPSHRLSASGTYILTAGTYQKQLFFRSRERLNFLCGVLLELAEEYEWKLEAWAVFPNHYHFVANAPKRAANLRRYIGELHAVTAREINRQEGQPGRKVWFQYWDSRITYERSYLARLNYVHTNAVKHGLVRRPEEYEWCSAGWFQRKAERPFYQTVMRMRSEGIKIEDDFMVMPSEIE